MRKLASGIPESQKGNDWGFVASGHCFVKSGKGLKPRYSDILARCGVVGIVLSNSKKLRVLVLTFSLRAASDWKIRSWSLRF